MEKIALPKKIDFKLGDGESDGLVVIEPLFPGYGSTIGNSLRRTLLSSLPGSAVVGVKIKGVKHEFMAVSGIKEDVVDIVLNLKQLRLRILDKTDEPIKLELNSSGKKQVTAKDIKKNSQVEIINNDLVLANITDLTVNLSMDIYVSNGMGYVLADKNIKEVKEVDYIDIDSVFSPVIGVSYKVENARVGKMTNWDKLILDIKTDGTISVEDAFRQAVKILIDQFNSLTSIMDGNKEAGSADVEPEVEVIAPKKTSTRAKVKKDKE